MRNVEVVFAAPGKAETRTEAISKPFLKSREVFVKKQITLIGAGTELACLAGIESWFPLPGVPGYAAIAEIVDIGPDVTEYEPGDIVFFYGKHSLYEVTRIDDNRYSLFMKLPDGLDWALAPFARMAAVAITAVRVSGIELGDKVAVTGLGLVGNFAAQLSAQQGAEVIGIDLSRSRLKLAAACGVAFPFSGTPEETREAVMGWTGGEGVSTLIEATGIPKVAMDGISWIRSRGELVLLGTPRGAYETDVTDLLSRVHVESMGMIEVKGAQEWRYPTRKDHFVKHSISRNAEIIFEWIRSERLRVRPLISHIILPQQAASAYEGLLHRKDDYQGVLFDWRDC